MLAAFRLRDTGQTFTVRYLPSPPGEDPMLFALHELRPRLIAAGVDLEDTLHAPYAVGYWLDEKEP